MEPTEHANARAHGRRGWHWSAWIAIAVVVAAGAALVTGRLADQDMADGAGFGDEFRPLSGDIESLGSDVGRTVTEAGDTAPADLADQFRSLAERTRSVRSDLGTLSPPPEAKEQFADLIRALSAAEDQIAALAEAVQGDEPAAARVETERLVTSSESIRAARLQLETLGSAP